MSREGTYARLSVTLLLVAMVVFAVVAVIGPDGYMGHILPSLMRAANWVFPN